MMCGNKNPEIRRNSFMVGGEFLTPDNVTMLVSLIGAVVGGATAGIKGIQCWVEERKSRKLRVKHKDFEIEINGALSQEEIEKRLNMISDYSFRIRNKGVNIEEELMVSVNIHEEDNIFGWKPLRGPFYRR